MILVLVVSGLTSICSAQSKVLCWAGVNLSNVSLDGGSADSELKPFNIGIDYATAINDSFEWTIGASYVTKGAKDWNPGFAQVDAYGTWNFVHSSNFRIGALTGPYADIMVAKDKAEETKTFSMGWQAGMIVSYKDYFLRAGYELGLTDVFDGGKSKANGVYIRVGYSF